MGRSLVENGKGKVIWVLWSGAGKVEPEVAIEETPTYYVGKWKFNNTKRRFYKNSDSHRVFLTHEEARLAGIIELRKRVEALEADYEILRGKIFRLKMLSEPAVDATIEN